MATQLMNEKVAFGIAKLIIKINGVALRVHHQDQVYWKDRGYKSDKMLSCMIPLEDHNLKYWS